MAITMQGNWTVKVKSKHAGFKQRFRIQGSDSADGVYNGVVSTPPVYVTGAQWTVSVEHKTSGRGALWIPSNDRLTTPARAGGQIAFDIQSDDSYGDQDYNDLILTCSRPESPSDYVIYGRVRTYKGLCKFNPCFPFHFVVDTVFQLKELLKYKKVRELLEEMYPERIRYYVERKILEKLPFPEPDPPPFRPMMIPMRAKPAEFREGLEQNRPMGTQAFPVSSASDTKSMRMNLGESAFARASSYHDAIRDLARIRDRIKPFCIVKDQPGLLLRFLEYDRTSDELAGGPYSGEGDRQILGLTVTDEQGRYIFHFTRTLEDIAEEFEDIEEGGASLATQLRPDIIAQIVGGMGGETGVLFETALFSNIPNLKRINICIPEDTLNPGPTACQGGRAIQAIGNIWTISGVGNTFDTAGRITATHENGPQITRGAWVGTLDMFACFVDLPNVKYYTIRYRRPGGTWSFVEQLYRHIYIPQIGDPSHPDHIVGPISRSLNVDGTPQTVPAYKNIELNPAWIATHRLRKIRLASSLYEGSLYEPEESPRTVEFKIEGYNGVGNKVPGAEDTIKLYIDNRSLAGDIDTISMGGVAPGECAFFELPTPNDPLTVRFKVKHPGGFLQRYHLLVIRGSNTSVPVSDITAPVQQPLILNYDEATHGNYFFGTFNAVNPDSEDYVLAVLQPNLGSWLAGLPPDKTFCAFAFEIYATRRVTNGYWKDTAHRLDVELVGISYVPPAP